MEGDLINFGLKTEKSGKSEVLDIKEKKHREKAFPSIS